MSWVSEAWDWVEENLLEGTPGPGPGSQVPVRPPQPSTPNSQMQYNYAYTDPTKPPPSQSGGNWVWDAAKAVWGFVKDNAGDILQTGASAVEGYMSSQDRAKALAEQARQFNESLKQRQAEAAQSAGQFDRTAGNTEAQLAVQAQTALNKAPMADKAQALLLSRMGVSPGTFQPRDYTKGTGDLLRTPAPPSANVTQTMQKAAANYQPGHGGVNTATTAWLLNRMRQSADRSAPPAPIAPRTEQPTNDLPVSDPGEDRRQHMHDQLDRFRRRVSA